MQCSIKVLKCIFCYDTQALVSIVSTLIRNTGHDYSLLYPPIRIILSNWRILLLMDMISRNASRQRPQLRLLKPFRVSKFLSKKLPLVNNSQIFAIAQCCRLYLSASAMESRVSSRHLLNVSLYYWRVLCQVTGY